MKIDIVIPIHNQIDNIPSIIDGLKSQSELFSTVWFVFDRTPIFDENKINEINVSLPFICEFIEFNPTDDMLRNGDFFVGAARNVGINTSLKNGSDIIIMIDGDCIPQRDLVKGHMESCNLDIPVLSCGRRREKSIKWRDSRETIPHLHNAGFFVKDIIINDVSFITSRSAVWSCNIAMNRLALKRIYKFNLKYYGFDGIFHPAFDGKWGGEDSFLGVEAWITRIFIVINSSASIEHIDHKKQSMLVEVERDKLFNEMLNDIRLKISLSPLNLKFFSDSH